MNNLNDREIEEIYRKRIDSESHHELTEDEKNVGEERRIKIDALAKEKRKKQGIDY